ncbi:MAG: hypothetical protein K0Q94_2402, partial [Paenibacillus sp.]|nr:hypothetical protein [Paenibacillus sp.]
MIERIFQRTDGYIEVSLQPDKKYIACQMLYSVGADSERSDWKPA